MKKLSSALLQTAMERIVQAAHPIRIYPYGSHAYGEPDDNSDIDILQKGVG